MNQTLLWLTGMLVLAACAAVPAAPPAFDGGKAYEHLRQIVAFGPRPSGSPALAQTRQYLIRELARLGVTAEEQAFEAKTPIGPIKMANVVGTIPGRSSDRLAFAGHYDTKLFREFPFVGANDGGSSAAFLLELARVLKERQNPLTIELLFFDGEEAIRPEWVSESTDHTYGSRHYVEAARQAGTLKTLRALILVDMIGDRDLHIQREAHSTPWLADLIWASARRLKKPEFSDQPTGEIEDDHIHFLRAGVPAVDIIDLQYRDPTGRDLWHTQADTLDKVAAGSLQAVGDVLLDALPAIEKRLAAGPGR
jgi:Zn-dependent M28 family amino/carboxypeptidase